MAAPAHSGTGSQPHLALPFQLSHRCRHQRPAPRWPRHGSAITRWTGALLVLLITGCSGPGAGPSGTDGRPLVLTSFTVLADMGSAVACGQLRVESITKPGAEIHGYEPTPSDLRRAQDAQLVLVNGLNLELWAQRYLASAQGAERAVVSEGVAVIPISADAGAGKPNPHAWMSPRLARTYVTNIRDAFIRLDPANAATYRRCAADYSRELEALDDELRQRLAVLPADRRLLVSCEGSLSYLAADYGLEEAYLWPVNAETEVTPQRMERVIRTVRERQVPAVFCESTVDDRPQRRVAEETGARFGGVFYVDSLSPPGGPAPTYLDMLRHNANTLVLGLQPDGQS